MDGEDENNQDITSNAEAPEGEGQPDQANAEGEGNQEFDVEEVDMSDFTITGNEVCIQTTLKYTNH